MPQPIHSHVLNHSRESFVSKGYQRPSLSSKASSLLLPQLTVPQSILYLYHRSSIRMPIHYITTDGEPPNGGRTPGHRGPAPPRPTQQPPPAPAGYIPHPPMAVRCYHAAPPAAPPVPMICHPIQPAPATYSGKCCKPVPPPPPTPAPAQPDPFICHPDPPATA